LVEGGRRGGEGGRTCFCRAAETDPATYFGRGKIVGSEADLLFVFLASFSERDPLTDSWAEDGRAAVLAMEKKRAGVKSV
jgi:hypothetical protein